MKGITYVDWFLLLVFVLLVFGFGEKSAYISDAKTYISIGNCIGTTPEVTGPHPHVDLPEEWMLIKPTDILSGTLRNDTLFIEFVHNH